MPTTLEVLRHHVSYTAWASQRLVDAAAALPPEELQRDFGSAFSSVLGTLVHVFAADRAWLGRIEGNPPARFMDPEKDMRLEVLQKDWPALMERWKQWVCKLDEASLLKDISYKDSKGNPYVNPIWQIVPHLVNHATHHRGQVSGFLRAMGHTPPAIDIIVYYREKLG